MFGYVSSPNSFPQPLTPEEESRYLEMYKKGDEEARNVLIERNLRLVAHIVKKYNAVGSDCDDLISIGTIGLIKAISTFDNEKGTRLATYAARCIENEILKSLAAPLSRNASPRRFIYKFRRGFGAQEVYIRWLPIINLRMQ